MKVGIITLVTLCTLVLGPLFPYVPFSFPQVMEEKQVHTSTPSKGLKLLSDDHSNKVQEKSDPTGIRTRDNWCKAEYSTDSTPVSSPVRLYILLK